ncbi:hypothetical protein ACXR8F_07910 [Terrabacter sp. AAH1]
MSVVHKPPTSLDYQWIYRGSNTFVGSASAVRRVSVRPAVTSAVSLTTLPLGGTFTYRVYLPADTDHLASYSPSRAVKVT